MAFGNKRKTKILFRILNVAFTKVKKKPLKTTETEQNDRLTYACNIRIVELHSRLNVMAVIGQAQNGPFKMEASILRGIKSI